MEDRPQNILVIKWGALGDLVAATTALRALREACPASRITLLSSRLMQQICPPGTLADEIIAVENRHRNALARANAEWKLVRLLRSRRFELAVNLRWTSEWSALLTWLSGARLRAGSGPPSLAFLYTHNGAVHTGRRHEFHRHLDILAPLGIAPRTILPFVSVPEADRGAVSEFFRKHDLRMETTAGMHPGASRTSKAWPPELYAELARRLHASRAARVLITWGPGEEPLARRVAEEAGAGIVIAPPTPTVGTLAAFIGACRLFVCNYSGPMNVAMAVETPLVALGSTSPEDWGPFGEMHRTINKSGEKDSYTEEEQLAMMKRISVDEVEALVVKRMQEINGGVKTTRRG